MRVKSAYIEQLEKDRPKGKCRRWRLWCNTDAGKKSRRFAGTYTQAKRALEALKVELEGIIPNADTFGGYAEARVAERESSGRITPNTVATESRYARAVRRSPMGSMRMDAIKPRDVRESLAWIRDHPQRPEICKGDVLSNTSMLGIHRFCNATFQQAVDDELLGRNPMAKMKEPKPDTEEVEALPWERMMALLDWLDALPLSAFVMAMYMIVCLGLRRSEACAVLDAGMGTAKVSIQGAVKDRDGSLGPPKSAAGERELPVMPRLSAKVDEWRARKREKGLDGSLTLACNVQGGVLRPQNLYRWWVEVTEGTEWEGVRLHQLRHSNLTKVARHMGTWDLMRYAGWSSPEPAKRYIHDDYDFMAKCVCEAWGVSARALIKKAA